MAELFGVAASVVSLTHVTLEGIKHALTFFRAKREFEELQEQLIQIHKIVEEFEELRSRSPTDKIADTLLRAKRDIECLNDIIQHDILRNVKVARARRSAWMRNKPKLERLLGSLKEHRNNLVAFICAETHVFIAQSQTTFHSISGDVRLTRDASFDMSQKLVDMQKSLLQIQNGIFSLNHVSQLEPSAAVRQSMQWPCHPDNHLLTTSTEDATWPRPNRLTGQGMDDEDVKTLKAHAMFRRQDIISSPLERSRLFLPESYTLDQLLPQSVFVMIGSESCSSTSFKTNTYRVLMLKGPRQWRRIYISVSIPRSSSYCMAMNTSKRAHHTSNLSFLAASSSMPHNIVRQLEDLLTAEDDLADDTHHAFVLREQTLTKWQDVPERDQIPLHVEFNEPSDDCEAIMTLLEDLGCRRYFEDEVQKIMVIEPPNRFVSCVEGTLVEELISMRPTPSQQLIYEIQVLRAMDGTPGFPRFVGITVDRTTTRLKSCLIGIPEDWTSFSIYRDGYLSSWESIEHVARQVVERITQVHSKGLVMGCLRPGFQPFILDNCGMLYAKHFEKKWKWSMDFAAYCPPEFDQLRYAPRHIPDAECPDTTTKTDIFNLGMILWSLAMGDPHKAPSRQSDGKDLYQPITLPRLPGGIPKYYQEIIDECRAENPRQRPAAWRILEKFPPPKKHEQYVTKANRQSPDPVKIRKGLATKYIWCSVCRVKVQLARFFHCHSCDIGWFDLCTECYDEGFHCWDDSHLLVEMSYEWGLLAPVRTYHSSVNRSGKRVITEL